MTSFEKKKLVTKLLYFDCVSFQRKNMLVAYFKEVQVAVVVVVFLMFSLYLCEEKQDYRDSFSSVIEVS